MTEQTGNNKPNEAEGLAFPLSGNEKLIESRFWAQVTPTGFCWEWDFEESPWGRTYTDAEIANALRHSEHHWATPETKAELTTIEEGEKR